MVQTKNITLQNSIAKSAILPNIGFALVVVGVPTGMFLNFLFPIAMRWSPVIMVLSVLLIMDYKNLLAIRFPSYNKIFGRILLFQFLMLFYGMLSDGKMTGQYLSFHLYIIVLIVACSTCKNNLDYKNIISTTFIFSGILVLLGAYFLNRGIVNHSNAILTEGAAERDDVLEVFTMSAAAVTNIICLLFMFGKKKKLLNILLVVFVVLDLYVIFAGSKRTPVAVTVVAVLIYFYKNGMVSWKNFRRYFSIFLLVVVALVIGYFQIGIVKETLDSFWEHFFVGATNIAGSTEYGTTESSVWRIYLRQWTYNHISNNFNLFNYIFGGGYMVRWLDNPILQSYLDMGIMGIMFYGGLVIIFPVKMIFRKNTIQYNTLTLFAVLLCLYNILSVFNSGNPYIYGKHTHIVVLAFVVGQIRAKIKMKTI